MKNCDSIKHVQNLMTLSNNFHFIIILYFFLWSNWLLVKSQAHISDNFHFIIILYFFVEKFVIQSTMMINSISRVHVSCNLGIFGANSSKITKGPIAFGSQACEDNNYMYYKYLIISHYNLKIYGYKMMITIPPKVTHFKHLENTTTIICGLMKNFRSA